MLKERVIELCEGEVPDPRNLGSMRRFLRANGRTNRAIGRMRIRDMRVQVEALLCVRYAQRLDRRRRSLGLQFMGPPIVGRMPTTPTEPRMQNVPTARAERIHQPAEKVPAESTVYRKVRAGLYEVVIGDTGPVLGMVERVNSKQWAAYLGRATGRPLGFGVNRDAARAHLL